MSGKGNEAMRSGVSNNYSHTLATALAKVHCLPLVGPDVLLADEELVQLHCFAVDGHRAATGPHEQGAGRYASAREGVAPATGRDIALLYLCWHRLGPRGCRPDEYLALVRAALPDLTPPAPPPRRAKHTPQEFFLNPDPAELADGIFTPNTTKH